MRWVKRILVFVLIVILGGTAYGVFTVRRSFPQVRGELQVAGLTDEVEVLRDDLGVPHIYAADQHDLFFAQGYIHAQDRFWQMDFWRHIGAWRLSEMFGSGQVETDMFLRSLGFQSLAEETGTASSPPVVTSSSTTPQASTPISTLTHRPRSVSSTPSCRCKTPHTRSTHGRRWTRSCGRR